MFKCQLFGRDVMVKQGFNKKYRHPLLDQKLTRKRTLQEARAMLKCRKAGIKAPLPYFVNYDTHEIYMEDVVNTITLRQHIDHLLKEDQDGSRDQLNNVAQQVARMLVRLHTINLVHGDLTTSNILIEQKQSSNAADSSELQMTLIDFGLSYTSDLYEDFGVDLYVLERAFLSTHPNTEWMLLLDTYMQNVTDVKKREETLSKLEEIRMRGRKRVMVG